MLEIKMHLEEMDGRNGDLRNESSMVVTSLRQRFERLTPISSDCCIYRVPQRVRRGNDTEYTPRVVSIGPLHHGSPHLQAMEEHKLRYLKDFLLRNKLSLEDYVNFLKDRVSRVIGSYGEAINLSCNEFLEMILVDAAFVIEVMLRYHFRSFRNEYDCVFSRRWLIKDVRYDMALLENQLPYFIFEDIFLMARITISTEYDERLSLIRLTHHIFQSKAHLDGIVKVKENLRFSRIQHFVHFLRICHLPGELPPRKELRNKSIPSATELHQAGVKFKQRSTQNIYDIRFEDGILEIPRFRIGSSTESLFRNLEAFEQCHCQESYISDYLYVMNCLIDTTHDVELLVRSGILESKLPDSQAVVTFLNNLVSGTIVTGRSFYFSDLCDDLRSFCNIPWHKWKATLKQNYFSTPWAVLSIIVAAAILILTFIQTVCSVISV